MIYPVKVYDKDGKLKKVIPSKKITDRSIKELDRVYHPSRKFGAHGTPLWRVISCRNCGIRIRTKSEKAVFCSVYCDGYWQKIVAKGKGKVFKEGGLDNYPIAKEELARRIASGEVFTKEGYKPVKRSDERI